MGMTPQVTVAGLDALNGSLTLMNRQLSLLITTLASSFISLADNNTFTGTNTFDGATTFDGAATFDGEAIFALPVQFPKHTVATLPVVTTSNTGQVAYATDARNTGQGVGLGTGALCAVDNTGAWAVIGTGLAPTA